MKLFRFDGEADSAKNIDRFGSQGFIAAHILAGAKDVHVVWAYLGPRGTIGRHPAVKSQLLLLVSGSAFVSGADWAPVAISTGQAAFWEPGEEHETSTEEGMTAVIIEAEEFGKILLEEIG